MKAFDKIEMGVCYYPEHWDKKLWKQDLERMKEAGITYIRIAEFAWNKFENKEGVFTFDFFDEFLDLVETTSIKVIFCTPTATPPAWLTEKYPEVLTVDMNGASHHHGARRHYNYNSEIYRQKTAMIVEQLARHYKDRKCIIGWQIDNEFNCVVNEFYSEADHKAFREFLQEKYKTLDALNEAWGTVFWNQTYTDWKEVYLPRHTHRDTTNPHLKLDSLRFYSHSCISYCQIQSDILRRYLKDNVFITSNSLFPHIDHAKLVKECLDFMTYDCYPSMGFMPGAEKMKDRKWSMNLAKARGTGKEFGIMEQQSGPGGWYNYRTIPTPKPGQIRLWTFQSIANGADFITYFRWRTCSFGTELYWHGILNYDNLDNRRLSEIRRTGSDLKKIEQVYGRKYKAQVAILNDYDNEWDGETDVLHGPVRRFSHMGLFKALQEAHIAFDYVSVTPDLNVETLKQYQAVFAPHMTIVRKELVAVIKEYVKQGGAFYTGARSGYKDIFGKCPMEVMPVYMSDLFGAEIHDFTVVTENAKCQSIRLCGCDVPAPLFHDMITPTDETCQVIGTYTEDYYKGEAACVKHPYGKGAAYYYGSAFSSESIKVLLNEQGIVSEISQFAEVPVSCETALRGDITSGYLFILNYEDSAAKISLHTDLHNMLTGKTDEGTVELEPYGVLVYKISEPNQNGQEGASCS